MKHIFWFHSSLFSGLVMGQKLLWSPGVQHVLGDGQGENDPVNSPGLLLSWYPSEPLLGLGLENPVL